MPDSFCRGIEQPRLESCLAGQSIYGKSRAWYLSVAENPKDVITAMLPGDLDISAWELRKALRQFAKGNPSLLEWFGSPIRYESDPAFARKLPPLIPEFFNPIKTAYHYLAIHDKAMADLDETGQIGIKKLFYALRGFFAAVWSAKQRSMPPTEFCQLLLPELFPPEILAAVDVLREQKKHAMEKQRLAMPAILAHFFRSQREIVEGRIKELKKTPGDPDKLNHILRQFVLAGEAPEKTDCAGFQESGKQEIFTIAYRDQPDSQPNKE